MEIPTNFQSSALPTALSRGLLGPLVLWETKGGTVDWTPVGSHFDSRALCADKLRLSPRREGAQAWEWGAPEE